MFGNDECAVGPARLAVVDNDRLPLPVFFGGIVAVFRVVDAVARKENVLNIYLTDVRREARINVIVEIALKLLAVDRQLVLFPRLAREQYFLKIGTLAVQRNLPRDRRCLERPISDDEESVR